jgi:hypothetical protein
LVYFYGHDEISEDKLNFLTGQASELAHKMQRRRLLNSESFGSAIIDFPSITNRTVFKYLESITRAFYVSQVIVLGDDHIFKKIKRVFPSLTVESLQSNPSAQHLSKTTLRQQKSFEVERYFNRHSENLISQ